jgi:hypothetical protein
LQAFATETLTQFFRNRNIEINPSALQFNVGLTTQTDVDGAPYVAFTGNASGGSGLTGSAIAGTVAAKDGTKFNVLFSSGSDNQDRAQYWIVGSDAEATRSLLVINAGSGHILGLIALPAQIPLY